MTFSIQGQRLEMPDDCPWDYYQLMLQMWHHEPQLRPKFAEIGNQLPDVWPETLKAVLACLDGQPDHLQYDEADLVVVLNRKWANTAWCFKILFLLLKIRPREYPDGYFWKGAVVGKKRTGVTAGVELGRTGLFMPSNFVTHLSLEHSPTRTYFI